MTTVLLAILPIFLVLLLGAVMRRFDFPGAGFWEPANRINYYLLFPALLVHTLARADFRGTGVVPMLGATAFGVLALAFVLIAARRALNIGGPAFTSLLQGAVRQNTFIGLAAAGSLHGNPGLALSSVLLAGYIPLVNPLCIAVLVRHGTMGASASAGRMLTEIARNPVPLACAVGLFLNLTGIGLPFGSAEALGILGQAALALGLLAAGAGLERLPVRATGAWVLVASLCKLVVMPALVWLPLALLDVHGLPRAIALIFAALPSASNAYVLAIVLGGDAALMAAILVVETALAVVTMPAALLLLG